MSSSSPSSPHHHPSNSCLPNLGHFLVTTTTSAASSWAFAAPPGPPFTSTPRAAWTFYRERNRANQWRLAVASVSSGAKAQVVDALGPALQLELGGKVGATSMSCSYFPDGQPVISSALRLTTSGDWYRLEGRYEGLNQRRISGSMVLAKRNLFQTGDRLLLGTSVEGFDEHHLFGRRATTSKYRWTAKWTSAASESVSFFNGGRGTSVTTLIATLKDTSRISPPSPSSNYCLSPEENSDLQCTVGVYIEEFPKSPKIFKYRRRTVNRKWPWSDRVTKWTSLEKYKEVNSSGWEVKFGKGCWPIVSFGASFLTKERDERRQQQQLKVKVNSRGELAAAIVSYRTDLTALFAPTTIFSVSGMVDVWRRRASIGFGLEFTDSVQFLAKSSMSCGCTAAASTAVHGRQAQSFGLRAVTFIIIIIIIIMGK
ncbi:hypothetical protein TYRP_023573 [Tyrophagus putrescentiae]|nr:hypothetical protein TYRP_023573 [Tyrophagus putrescentiae]